MRGVVIERRPLTAWGPDIGIGMAMKLLRDWCDEGAADAFWSCDEATKATARKQDGSEDRRLRQAYSPLRPVIPAQERVKKSLYRHPDENQDLSSSTCSRRDWPQGSEILTFRQDDDQRECFSRSKQKFPFSSLAWSPRVRGVCTRCGAGRFCQYVSLLFHRNKLCTA